MWKCRNCGYEGSIVIEDGNIEKILKKLERWIKSQKSFLGEDKL